MINLTAETPDPNAYHRLLSAAAIRDRKTAEALQVLDSSDTSQPDPWIAGIIVSGIESEDIGGYASQSLLTLPVSASQRAALVRATWDEIRHSGLFTSMARSLDIEPTSFAEAAHPLWEQLRSESDPMAFLVLHVELEALALDVFRMVAKALGASPIGHVFGVVAADEASHVRLGRELIKSQFQLTDSSTTWRHALDNDMLRAVHHSARDLSPAASFVSTAKCARALGLSETGLFESLSEAAERRWKWHESIIEQRGRR